MLPTVRSIKGLMTLSFMAPLAVLSIFPHQEPRFLIPLIIPLVYLYSSNILPESDNVLVKLDVTITKKYNGSVKNSNVFMKLWLCVNLILLIFFGFLHQGGVYQCVNYLSKDMKLESPKTEYHIITSHIYMLPSSLFLQKSSNILYQAKSTKYVVSKRFYLYEKGSVDIETLVEDIQRLYRKFEDYKSKFKTKKWKLILIVPSSLEDHISYLLLNNKMQFKKIKTFYPHVSTEAFPDLAQDFYFYLNIKNVEGFYAFAVHCFSKFMSSFGLNLYEVTLT